MPKIFLSYRRDDNLFAVDWIDHALSEQFGRESIVRDIDTFPLGRDFRVVISQEVNACDILLAIIGERWLDMRYTVGEKAGQRRIDDPADYVRLEIEAALQRDIPVIPVLIDRASLPHVADVPASLQDLIYRGAAEVRAGQDRETHINRLISGIHALIAHAERELSPDRPAELQTPTRRKSSSRVVILAAVIGVMILAVIVYNQQAKQREKIAIPEIEEKKATLPPRPPELSKTMSNRIGMEFVLIPAGSFMMGTPKEQLDDIAGDDKDYRAWIENETPQHRVTISKPFYMGKYEVTQAQWKAVMGNNPSGFKGDDRPVEQVSWNDMDQFIKKLNAMEGKEVCRLPTEAEWEYAARAEEKKRHSFDDDASQLGDYAWYRNNSGGETHPVGQRTPNAWGLYDMHGNVWEWVQDWYAEDYYRNSPDVDPQGPNAGADRVIRGGGWADAPQDVRSAHRYRSVPGFSSVDKGFRCSSSG